MVLLPVTSLKYFINSIAVSLNHSTLSKTLKLGNIEAAIRVVLWKKLLLQISQYSQENTYDEVFL